MTIFPHVSVLLQEAIDALAVSPQGVYLDCTFGRGGHSRAILERLGTAGRLLAFDRDADAVSSAEAEALRRDDRFVLVHSRFGLLEEQVRQLGYAGRLAGVLMDLGVSSPQVDTAERGFSFLRDGPLDMRMDTAGGPSAAEWLAGVKETELVEVLRVYGEERFARRIARAVIDQRRSGALTTTGQLAELIAQAVPTREPGKHPATRSFQAIRIYVNDELGELQQGLEQSLNVLAPTGRLAVIAFHSLEDRLVKRFMRDHERGYAAGAPRWVQGTPLLRRVGKAIHPSAEEVERNPRARSAVLRVAERLPWV